MNPQKPVGPVSGILASQFKREERILKARGFMRDSPKGAHRIARDVIRFIPDDAEAWVILFQSACKMQQGKKKYFWTPLTEKIIAATTRIRNLQNAADVLTDHPTNIALWHKVCDILSPAKDRKLEEAIRRIIFECDRANMQSLLELADFLCQKAQFLADQKDQVVWFAEAVGLAESACKAHPDDLELRKKRDHFLAVAASCEWEVAVQAGTGYRGLIAPEGSWPTV